MYRLTVTVGRGLPLSDRARRGARGALYSKPSSCGAEFPPEGGWSSGLAPGLLVLKIGSCAAGDRESGQVRKEAALSGPSRVLRDRPVGANVPGHAGYRRSTAGARLAPSPHALRDRTARHSFSRIAAHTKPMGPRRHVSTRRSGDDASSVSGGGCLSSVRWR